MIYFLNANTGKRLAMSLLLTVILFGFVLKDYDLFGFTLAQNLALNPGPFNIRSPYLESIIGLNGQDLIKFHGLTGICGKFLQLQDFSLLNPVLFAAGLNNSVQ